MTPGIARLRQYARTHLAPIATGLCLVALVLLAIPSPFAPAKAQTSTAYLPSVKIGTAALIDPAMADSYYGTSTVSTNGLGTTVRPPEIVALARALKNDPDLIYQYVRNNIEVVWEYGLQKGALGAMIDRAGTPFDQAMLMVELLRQAGFTATYEIGTITLSGADFAAWTNITSATAACQMLSGGAIPAKINGTVSATCSYGSDTVTTVQMAHAWVKVAISGSTCGSSCLFDPSYKPYTWLAGINLVTATGFTAGAAMTQATSGMDSGTASGLPYVHNLNAGALNTLVQGYATSLLSYLRTNNLGGVQMEGIVGGGVIAPAPTTALRQTSLPYSASAIQHEWTGNVPDQYRCTLRLEGAMRNPNTLLIETLFDKTFFVDEIYGRRLNIGTNFNIAAGLSAYNQYVTDIKLDDQEIAGTSHTIVATPNTHDPMALTIVANHPYAAAADGSSSTTGDYMDATIYKTATAANPVTIVNGWGDTGPDLLAKWSAERAEDTADPMRLDPPVCTTEPCNPLPAYLASSGDFTRDKVSAAYLAQYTRAARLHAALANGIVQTHHVIGVIYGDDYVEDDNAGRTDGSQPDYWVADSYIRVDVDTGLSFSSKAADAGKRRAAIQAIAATGAMLEGSVVQQMSDIPDSSSTATRFEWGNAPPAAEDPSAGGPRRFFTYAPSTTVPSSWVLWENATTPPASGGITDGNPQVWAPEEMAALSSDINAYTAGGFTVTVSQESFLGPGQRGGYVKVLTDPHSHIHTYDPSYTKQRGGAFVATRYNTSGDPVEIAHDVVGVIAPDSYGVIRPAKGGGGGVQPNIAATYAPSDPADVLKARFVDRSNALGINLANGSLSYQSPATLSLGTGGFPYALDASYAWHPGPAPTDFGPVPQGPSTGWLHNWHNSLAISGSGMEAMGASDIRAAAGTIASFMVEQDIYTASPSAQRDVAAVLSQAWLSHQYAGNSVTVEVGGATRQFVRLADGSWIQPGAGYAVLAQSGTRAPFEIKCGIDQGGPRYALTRGWDSSGLSFAVTNAHGDVENFGYWLWHDTGTTGPNDFCDRATGFRLNSWSFPSGVSVNLTYQDDVTVKDGASRSTSPNADVFYPSGTIVATVTNNLGRVLTYGFNASTGQPTVTDGTRTLTGPQNYAGSGTTDPAGNVTGFTYLGGAATSPTQRPIPYFQLSQVYTADNPSLPNIEYDYDGTGRVYQVRDAINLQVGDHTVAGGRDPWTFYLADNWRGERDDPLGNGYKVVYDTYRHPFRYIDENNHETDSVTDSRGRVVSYTYPEGDQEVFTYDERNNGLSLTRKAKPLSGLADLTVSVAYEEGATVAVCSNIVICNKPASHTNARGFTTNYSWNGTTGLLTQILLPAPISGGTRPETDYSYTVYTPGFSLLTGTTAYIDATHTRVTTIAFNAANFYVPQSVTIDPSGLALTSTYTFDAIGNPTAVDGPRTDVTDVTNFTWDPNRREIFGIQPDPDGTGPRLRPAFKTTYDAVGRVTQFDSGTASDAIGSGFTSTLTITTAYDPASNKIKVTTPTSVTQMSYDGTNRPLCTATRMNPSVFGSLPSDACTLGTTGSYGPDRITKMAYDPAGQVLQELRAVGTSIQQTYATNTWTPNGKLASVYDADGAAHITTYAYDGFDRLQTTTFADSTTEQVTAYDEDSNVLTHVNRSGQTFSLSYDRLDRLTTKAIPAAGAIPANTVTTGYDLLNQVTSISDTYGNTIAEVYDVLGRKTSETRTTPTLSSKMVSYQYDAAGNRTRLTWPDGYYANYTYDALNHPATVIDSRSSTLATYTYDDLGRRTQIQYAGTTGAKIAYAWSPENDLTTLTNDLNGTANDVTYTNTFTPAHQWLTSTISNPVNRFTPPSALSQTYGAANNINQYPSLGSTMLAYDTRGNYLGSASAPSFVYDAENRLMTATSGIAYAYDPLGRRTMKTVSGAATNFVHDGDSEIAEYDGSGTLIRHFVPGAAVDEYIAMVSASGTKTFFHTDKMGSVIAMSDTNGNIVEGPYTYDEYGACYAGGTACSATSITSGSPFRFTGQRYDPETSTYYYRARVYSPLFGRFFQTDPVGYKADFNLYSYVGNDPTDRADPSGRVVVWKFEHGGTQQQADDAQKYLMNSPTYAADYKALSDSKDTITIIVNPDHANATGRFNDQGDHPGGIAIIWNPTMGLENKSGLKQSASLGLAHELAGHAARDHKDPAGYAKEIPQYQGGIQVTEIHATAISNKIAKELGEPQQANYLDVNENQPHPPVHDVTSHDTP